MSIQINVENLPTAVWSKYCHQKWWMSGFSHYGPKSARGKSKVIGMRSIQRENEEWRKKSKTSVRGVKF